MRELAENDVMGFDPATKILVAMVAPEDSVRLGDLFGVPKQHIPSGVGKVVGIDSMNVTCTSGLLKMWFIEMVERKVKPDNPCDVDYMEKISS